MRERKTKFPIRKSSWMALRSWETSLTLQTLSKLHWSEISLRDRMNSSCLLEHPVLLNRSALNSPKDLRRPSDQSFLGSYHFHTVL